MRDRREGGQIAPERTGLVRVVQHDLVESQGPTGPARSSNSPTEPGWSVGSATSSTRPMPPDPGRRHVHAAERSSTAGRRRRACRARRSGPGPAVRWSPSAARSRRPPPCSGPGAGDGERHPWRLPAARGGGCLQRGIVRPATWSSVRVNRRSSSSTNSAKRSARSAVLHGTCPSTVASGPWLPAPIPRSKRPSTRSSRVTTSRARLTG